MRQSTPPAAAACPTCPILATICCEGGGHVVLRQTTPNLSNIGLNNSCVDVQVLRQAILLPTLPVECNKRAQYVHRNNLCNMWKRECKSAFAHSVHLEFSDFRQCSHITVFSSSSSSPTTTTSSSSLSLPPTVKGGEGGWVAPLEEENNYLGHIHTQTLLHTHTQRHTTTQMHKYDNT